MSEPAPKKSRHFMTQAEKLQQATTQQQTIAAAARATAAAAANADTVQDINAPILHQADLVFFTFERTFYQFLVQIRLLM